MQTETKKKKEIEVVQYHKKCGNFATSNQSK